MNYVKGNFTYKGVYLLYDQHSLFYSLSIIAQNLHLFLSILADSRNTVGFQFTHLRTPTIRGTIHTPKYIYNQGHDFNFHILYPSQFSDKFLIFRQFITLIYVHSMIGHYSYLTNRSVLFCFCGVLFLWCLVFVFFSKIHDYYIRSSCLDGVTSWAIIKLFFQNSLWSNPKSFAHYTAVAKLLCLRLCSMGPACYIYCLYCCTLSLQMWHLLFLLCLFIHRIYVFFPDAFVLGYNVKKLL